jgi:hypothetical protein
MAVVAVTALWCKLCVSCLFNVEYVSVLCMNYDCNIYYCHLCFLPNVFRSLFTSGCLFSIS